MFPISRSSFKSILQPLFAVLFSLLVLPWANAVSYPGTGTPAAIPDPGSVNVTFTVSGHTAPITSISLDVNLSHAWAGDVVMVLTSPTGVAIDIVRSAGWNTASNNGNDNYAGAYTFVDPSTPGALNIWTAATVTGDVNIPPGTYQTSGANGVATNLFSTYSGLSAAQVNGTWTLTVSDVDAIISGTVNSASLNLVGPAGTNAVCGTPPASIVAPSGAALCSSGTGTAVTSGVNTFTWGCNSTDGGTNTAANACSSIRQYTVTATPAAGATGSISCTTPVNGGGTTSCTASPAMGYITGSISGCGGAATGSGVNAYTTAAVVADCTVTATFLQIVNGTCGAANSVAVHDAPSAGLCGTGTASAITTAAGQFTWTCDGANTGTNASCAAPRTYLLTASVSGGNGTATAAAGGVVAYNAAGTATITPNAGYSTITPLGGTCTGSLVGATFTSNPMTADCSLIASFLQLPIAPTTAVSPASGGTVSCVGPAVFGGTSTCTASPAAGYLFTGFSGCGGTPTSSLTYVTGPITGACLVTASFTSVSIPTLSPMVLAVLALLALLVGGFSLRKRVL